MASCFYSILSITDCPRVSYSRHAGALLFQNVIKAMFGMGPAAAAKLPLQGFGEIERWLNNLMDLPAWREPLPV